MSRMLALLRQCSVSGALSLEDLVSTTPFMHNHLTKQTVTIRPYLSIFQLFEKFESSHPGPAPLYDGVRRRICPPAVRVRVRARPGEPARIQFHISSSLTAAPLLLSSRGIYRGKISGVSLSHAFALSSLSLSLSLSAASPVPSLPEDGFSERERPSF